MQVEDLEFTWILRIRLLQELRGLRGTTRRRSFCHCGARRCPSNLLVRGERMASHSREGGRRGAEGDIFPEHSDGNKAIERRQLLHFAPVKSIIGLSFQPVKS